MTVAELIVELRRQDPRERVLILDASGGEYHLRSLGTIRAVKHFDRWDGLGAATLLDLEDER